MAFLKLLLAFAPWLAFLFIAHGSLFRLKLGLVVALVISIVLGVTGLHRGIILWGGLLFFIGATIAVVGFDNLWTAHYMGVIASSVLAVGTWLTVVLGKPFTLDYARQHVDPSQWNSPAFLHTNFVITSVWGGVFTVNAVLAWAKIEQLLPMPPEGYEVTTYTLMIGTALFTTWYPNHARRAQG